MPDNFYDVLGVSRRASDNDIRAAYRSRAKTLHPDAGGDAAQFAHLTEAYETLLDPTQRRLYDTWLRGERRTPGSPSSTSGLDDDVAIAMLLHQYAAMRRSALENLKRSALWAGVSLFLCVVSLAGAGDGVSESLILWLPAFYGINRSYRIWQHYRALTVAEQALRDRVRGRR